MGETEEPIADSLPLDLFVSFHHVPRLPLPADAALTIPTAICALGIRPLAFRVLERVGGLFFDLSLGRA